MGTLEIIEQINQRGILDASFFGGVVGPYRIQQNPEEFAELIQFLKDRFPEGIPLYLEIGTAGAGTLRTIVELVGINQIVSIDFGTYDYMKQLDNTKEFSKRMISFLGDSHSQDAYKFATSFPKFDVIFIDGDHSYDGVIKDVELCLNCAHDDTVFIFHDIILGARWDSQHGCFCNVKQAYEFVRGKYFEEMGRFINPSSPNPLGIGVCKLRTGEAR